MNLSNAMLTAALVAATWHVVVTILIYEYLRQRGHKPSFLLLRLYSPVNARTYRELTTADSGKTGPLFWHWVASINVALVATIVALVVLA